MKLLEKNPADRYATGTDLAQALDQVLADADASWDSRATSAFANRADAWWPCRGAAGTQR